MRRGRLPPAVADGHRLHLDRLVGVTVLGWPDQLVEVEAVAVLDSWREPAPPHDHPDEDA